MKRSLCDLDGDDDSQSALPCNAAGSSGDSEHTLNQSNTPLGGKTVDSLRGDKTWQERISEAFEPVLRALGRQRRPFTIATGCSGTGAPTLALQERQQSIATLCAFLVRLHEQFTYVDILFNICFVAFGDGATESFCSFRHA
eukprot:5880214-Amphidinium_carterae.1